MWLKLTDSDGNIVHVNMNNIEAFYTDGKNTTLWPRDSSSGYSVKETLDEIGDMLKGGNWK